MGWCKCCVVMLYCLLWININYMSMYLSLYRMHCSTQRVTICVYMFFYVATVSFDGECYGWWVSGLVLKCPYHYVLLSTRPCCLFYTKMRILLSNWWLLPLLKMISFDSVFKIHLIPPIEVVTYLLQDWKGVGRMVSKTYSVRLHG